MKKPFVLVMRLTAVASLACGSPTMARPMAPAVNVREACRQDVAGAYIEAYDIKERTGDYAKALAIQVASLDAGIKDARTVLAKAKAEADQHSFDAKRAIAVDQAAASLRGLEAQRDESARSEATAKAQLEALASAEVALRKAVETVFVLTRIGGKVDGGYPFRIEYRSPCPKYRHVCALPTTDAERLAKLAIRGQVPVACSRYATIRGRQP